MSKQFFLVFVVFLGLTTSAVSKERVVIVMSNAFFPATTVVAVGDTVRFVNTTPEPQTIIASNAGWIIGPLGTNQEAVLTISEAISLRFTTIGKTGMRGMFKLVGAQSN